MEEEEAPLVAELAISFGLLLRYTKHKDEESIWVLYNRFCFLCGQN